MDNQRLILLLVFSFSLMMLWDAWQKQGLPPPAPAGVTAQQGAGSSAIPAPIASPTASPLAAAALPAAALPAATTIAKTVVKTDLFNAQISAQGGDLVHLELTQHRAAEDMTIGYLELIVSNFRKLFQHRAAEDTSKNFVLFDNGEKHIYEAQSGLIGKDLPNHNTLFHLESNDYELKAGQASLEVRLDAPAVNGVKVRKVYTFHRGSYLIDVGYEIVNEGATPFASQAYFLTKRDGKAPEGDPKMVSTFTGAAVYTDQDKYQKLSFDDIGKGKDKHTQKADNGWIAVIQHYFVSAWLPPPGVEREYFTSKEDNNLYRIGVKVPVPAVAPGASGKVVVRLYAGPQEQEKLEKIAPGLNLVVDYGWLTIIAAPLFWVLELIHRWVGNWGWAIIGLTVLLKLIFFPLSAASYKSMAKMKLVTPKLAKLKELYADDRARLNQEMMELYKREKINPLGGCLPIVVQIPVFIALYWVLLGTVEMRHAPWLGWIVDLSAMDPYLILPLLMGATMLAQTKLNPAPPDPIQAKVMMFMPIIFTTMFLFSPSGLVLYWTVNNLLSIAQQWQITRLITGGKKAA